MGDTVRLDLAGRGLAGLWAPQHGDCTMLDVSNNPLLDLDFLVRFPHLRVLEARNANLADIVQIPTVSARRLIRLDVAGNNINSLEGLSECDDLEMLDVSNNPLETNGERGIRWRLGKLQELSFRGTPLNAISLAKILARDALSGARGPRVQNTISRGKENRRLESGDFLGAAGADSLDFGAVKITVTSTEFNDGRFVFGLRGEVCKAASFFHEAIDIVVHVVRSGNVRLVARSALFPGNARTGMEVSLPRNVLGGPRMAFVYILISARFRDVLRICAFDALAGGIQVTLEEAETAVQARLEALFQAITTDHEESFSTTVKTANFSTQQSQAHGLTELGSQVTRSSNSKSELAGAKAYAQHFDTRLRLSTGMEGNWLRVLPDGPVDDALWFQTVLTFGQIVTEVQAYVDRFYGVPLAYGKAAELAFAGFSNYDVFDGYVHLKLSWGRFGEILFDTPIETLDGATGRTQALCREPDKIILARVRRGRVFTSLNSLPIEFSNESALRGTAVLRLLGSTLVCIFYSDHPGEGVTYRFLRDDSIVQESASPFLNIAATATGLGGSGGTYRVEVTTGDFVAVTTEIRLNNFFQVVNQEMAGTHLTNLTDNAEGAMSQNFSILQQAQIPGNVVAASLRDTSENKEDKGSNQKKKKRWEKEKAPVEGQNDTVESVHNAEGEILDFPVAEPVADEQDIEKQLQFLGKQKQIEELRKQLDDIRELIDAEKKQQEDQLKQQKNSPKAQKPKYSTTNASQAQINRYNQLYANQEGSDGELSEQSDSREQRKGKKLTAAEKLKRDSKEHLVRQTNAPPTHPLVAEPSQAHEMRRLRRAAARSNDAPIQNQGSVSRATDRYAEHVDSNVLARGAPYRPSQRHRPALIDGLDSTGIRASPQPGRGAITEGKKADKHHPTKLKKPTFKPVVVDYVPDTARLRVDGLQQYQWNTVHEARGPGLDENETKTWKDFKVPAPEDEYFV